MCNYNYFSFCFQSKSLIIFFICIFSSTDNGYAPTTGLNPNIQGKMFSVHALLKP